MDKYNSFIQDYISASNAATASKVDSNANITNKTMASLEVEMFKSETIKTNRERLKQYMTEEIHDAYLALLDEHFIYTHDESSLKPYCASISLYPFLLEGTKCIGGVSGPPKNLQSFCGSFVNFVYQVAADYAGAVATVEFLGYFDYFARKQYGKHYHITHRDEVIQELQGVVYALNQPASARGAQSVFWNISVFDKPYFEAMFGEFFFPDGTQHDYNSVRALQDLFMEWFAGERRKELLTFPVVTASHLTDGNGNFVDGIFKRARTADMARGLSFFVYMSDSADSLASCCRLRNELSDNTFSYSLGAGGVVTGSSQVITINLARLAMGVVRRLAEEELEVQTREEYFLDSLKDTVEYVHCFLIAHKEMYRDYINAGLLPTFTAGIMDLDKQFLTVGLNGIVEAAEEFGYQATPHDKGYVQFLKNLLSTVKELNKTEGAVHGVRFNTEFVPAENLGVKFARWDKETFGSVRSECYNSYFYRPEDDLSIVERLALFGEEVTQYLDGGSAVHLNLEQLMSVEQADSLYNMAAKFKVPYWTYNVLSTCCNNCGAIDPQTRTMCAKCGSKDIDYATRVIGYLKRIKNFSEARQKEAGYRTYMKRGIYKYD